MARINNGLAHQLRNNNLFVDGRGRLRQDLDKSRSKVAVRVRAAGTDDPKDLQRAFRALKDRLKRFGCSGGPFALDKGELAQLNSLAQRLRQLGL